MVTNSFTALGKDNYLTFATVTARGDAVNTYLDYAQSFVDTSSKKELWVDRQPRITPPSTSTMPVAYCSNKGR